MNQIGHLPQNAATVGESFLFTNSVMYVSQRKQCEICAANQADQENVHFVRRINAVNQEKILTALQNGGSYWYPLDGCYQLTEDLTLPENWTPIKGFKGHWNSDVYTVTLNKKGVPLLDNSKAEGEKGWNLGTDQTQGRQGVFNSGMTRTTGVARVLGDLNDLFGTTMCYAGYTVKILGADNPSYMSAGEAYTCTVNTDSKYVISNLPCIFDAKTRNGVLKARVYTPDGKELTQYGSIRVNVDKDFWNNDMTTPLYLGSLAVEPVEDEQTYESAQAFFSATTIANEKPALLGWEFRKSESDVWQKIPASWDTKVENEERLTAEGDFLLRSALTLNNTGPAWDGYEFRAVFHSSSFGQWNTFEYWQKGAAASGNESADSIYKPIYQPGVSGKLKVHLWPAYAEQGPDQTAYAGTKATFRSVGYALDDGTAITGEWQYSTDAFDKWKGGAYLEWHDIKGSHEWGGQESVTITKPKQEYRLGIDSALAELNPQADTAMFHERAKFHSVESYLIVDKVDIAQKGTHFRVHYTAISSHGTKTEWYSNIADEKSGAWTTEDGLFGGAAIQAVEKRSNILNVILPELEVVTTPSALCGGLPHMDTMTPDEYGQMLLLPNAATEVANGTATYEAVVYYKPGARVPDVTWQYMTYADRAPKFWADTRGNTNSAADTYGLSVSVTNTDLGEARYKDVSGYRAIKSVMTISNIPGSIYNPETLTKFYFRCIAASSYTTSKETYSMTRVDKWGGLVVDYAIDLHHNGVINYGNTNEINGAVVTDAEGIVQATKNKQFSVWKYPKLSIHIPSGHHVNTAIIYFQNSSAYDARDSINYDAAAIEAFDITVSEADASKLVLVSAVKNTVETDAWETVLREHVSFTTYDDADFTAAKVAAGTTGGAPIRWAVDELRLAGVSLDPNTGRAYRVKNAGRILSWEEAFAEARAYDAEMGANGQLAQITNQTENSLVYALKGGNNGTPVWLGANKTSGVWQWKTNGDGVNYTPGGIGGNGPYLAMNADGNWSGLKASGSTSKDVVMSAVAGTDFMYPFGDVNMGIPVADAGYMTFNLIEGHKYFVLAKYGDYGDSNGGGAIWCDALPSMYAHNNWKNTYNEWMTGIEDIYTASASGVSYIKWSVTDVGTPLSNNGNGGWTALYYIRVFDLTATFGAGNEPDAATCRSWFPNASKYRDLDSPGGLSGTAYLPAYSVDVKVGEQSITDVQHYAVEYVIPSLAFAVTDHSAEDETFIGTNAKYGPALGSRTVTAVLDGNSKVYNGTPLSPAAFTVYGSEGAGEPFPVYRTVKSGKKQNETQNISRVHS